MALKRKSNTKENLNWKINVLAAKAGEDTHIEQAKKAALNKRQNMKTTVAGEDNNDDNQELLRQQLMEAKKKKLETKLFHARKETRSCLKKSKAAELQKQVRKLREAQHSLTVTPTKTIEIESKENNTATNTNESINQDEESASTAITTETIKINDESIVKDESTTKKKIKVYTPQNVERFEKELEIIKTIDLDSLADKALNKLIQKNATLKKDEMISTLLPTIVPTTKASSLESTSSTDDMLLTSNIEARLLGNKILTGQMKKEISEIEMLLLGSEQRKLIKDTKRKAAEEHQPQKRSRTTSTTSSDTASSLFITSLGGDDQQVDNDKKKSKTMKKTSGLEWEDPDFDKYYNGAPEKQNRPGQRQRRMKWEAIHGKNAKHIAEGKKSVQEQRRAKQAKKQHQREASSFKKDNTRRSEFKTNGDEKKQENLEEYHPSWQAKRQQQELMAKALSGQGTGNKIVFDDED